MATEKDYEKRANAASLAHAADDVSRLAKRIADGGSLYEEGKLRDAIGLLQFSVDRYRQVAP